MKNYVEIAYQEKEKPFGEYPLQLAHYLAERYHLKPAMKLLDNGCGRGEFLHAFRQVGLETYGTDLSDRCPGVKVVDLNCGRLPFDDGYFDVVFSKSVIEHIDKTEHYLEEMRRVLRDDGLLILMVPDWETQYKIFYQDPTHIHPYTVKSVERLLGMMEFRHIQVEKFAQLPETWGGGAVYIWQKKLWLNLLSKSLRCFGPVNKVYKNKFVRFSRELMVFASATK